MSARPAKKQETVRKLQNKYKRVKVMSKPLEALDEIEYLAFDAHLGETIIDEIKKIKQALAPPTEEEVCEALEDWFKGDFSEIKIVYTKKAFIEVNYDGDIICGLEGGFVIWNNVDLPPHIITMIGRFYEAQND